MCPSKNRLLQQAEVSAGFGAMARHLRRLRIGLEEALELDLLDQASLSMLQPRSPAINMTAAMQFSMGTRTGPSLSYRITKKFSC